MNKRILLCDDDKDILQLCTLILEKSNYTVATSTDCESIFPRMKSINPDLIIMDIWIPEMGGEAATIKLKTDIETRGIPVLLFSANKEIEEIAIKTGANGYISKPFELASFLKTIDQNIVK